MLQSDIIDFLMKPSAFDLPVSEKIDRFDTHISVVFLAGKYAYKLKRAIRLPFVDFRHLEDRKKYCQLELEVNQAGAPGMYMGLAAVTQKNGRLSLNGDGDVVEWLVRMKRFDQADLFDHLCDEGKLDSNHMDRLCDHLIEVYEHSRSDHVFGGAEGMIRAFDGHYKAIENCPSHILPADQVARLKARVAEEIEEQTPLLDDRQETGFVRHCHGDLHLRNICFFEGKIALFDAIEFEPDFAIIDLLYDLSFLIMDLCHRNKAGLANDVFNRYLGRTGDLTGAHLLNLFLVSRAAIRTHVNAVASANQADVATRLSWERDARCYLDEALAYLKPAKPVLIAVGGLSGSGKSVLAKTLAPSVGKKPGAFIARTDMIRKRLMGVKPQEKLGPEGYTKGVTSHTYNTLYVEMRLALHAGYSVIVDGVFAKEEEREALDATALAMGVPFVGLWLDTDQNVLETRVAHRQGDVSDADVSVVRMQADYDVGSINWHHIDAGKSPNEVYQAARSILTEYMDFVSE